MWGVAKIASNSILNSYELKRNTAFRTLTNFHRKVYIRAKQHLLANMISNSGPSVGSVLWMHILLSAAHQKTGNVAGCVIFSPWILKCRIHGQFHDCYWLLSATIFNLTLRSYEWRRVLGIFAIEHEVEVKLLLFMMSLTEFKSVGWCK